MADAYTFEHEGYTVSYFPLTVRSSLKNQRYLVALITHYGYETGADVDEKNPEEWANFKEYAGSMAQCQTNAPWYVGSMSTPKQVAAAYELFLEQNPALFVEFFNANKAVQTPKKTDMSSPEISLP